MSQTHTFNTACGQVVGYESNGILYARGIPYAQAGRFEKPSPVKPWNEPFEAKTSSPACPQIKDELGEKLLQTTILKGLEISEACLNLSVTLPASAADTDSSATGLPVLAFIHGGAYVTGAADASIYDPTSMVKEHNIVVVMINYRLGLFGYIGDGSPARPANLGLLDQLTALKWIQANIGAFGGDPKNVTVAGQSAGADAVMHLLATESAPELFRRMIVQSAPLGIRGGRLKMSEALFKFSKDLTPETPVEEVIDRTEKGIISVRRFGLMAGMCMATQYGFEPLPPEDQLEAVWLKNSRNIDILIGNTRDEVTVFGETIKGLDFVFGLPVVGGFIKHQVVQYFTKKIYEDETKRLANLLGKNGKTWLYDFYWHIKGNKYQSGHAIELMLEWDNRGAWGKSKFLEGGGWETVQRDGQKFRALLARFVKGVALEEVGEVEGVVKYARASQS